MAKTLTMANAVITLVVPAIELGPFQLQRFAADDVFNTGELDVAETSMGVDGNLSAGFVFREVAQDYTLQGNSDSIANFDQWYQAEQTAKDKYQASGTIILKAIGMKYNMVIGFLKGYTPVPSGGKIIKPRKFTIHWQSATPVPA